MFLVNVEVTMSGTLKIRLRAGVREIEIEGNRSDVDDLLSKWWTSVDSAQTENETETETENSIERTARTPKRKNQPYRMQPGGFTDELWRQNIPFDKLPD